MGKIPAFTQGSKTRVQAGIEKLTNTIRRVEKRSGHLQGFARSVCAIPYTGSGHTIQSLPLCEAELVRQRIIFVVAGSLPGGLFIRVFLLRHFFAKLASPVTMHPGLVLVDALLRIGGRIGAIIHNDNILAE
jgi:hypothetical protein